MEALELYVEGDMPEHFPLQKAVLHDCAGHRRLYGFDDRRIWTERFDL